MVGVCMQADTVRPMIAIGKELNLQFVLGYDPWSSPRPSAASAEGELDVDPLITGSVDIDGRPRRLRRPGHPDAHAKILVEP